ncbi:protein PTHB1-like isoform X3 [Tachypleus tridentatus]|uniref:protein PTHB1-like isoform X3 n=1 Tax=Tachypleus tridentatus TaxID=6853 RepID=UPI003FD17FEB
MKCLLHGHRALWRFHVLEVAKDGETSDESQNMTKWKRVVADWLFSLGEAALDIFVAEFSNAPSTIFVLGEVIKKYCHMLTSVIYNHAAI